jgi:hypothetical protein
MSLTTTDFFRVLTQLDPHKSISIVSGDSEALCGSITLPPALKTDSEATLDIGIARISRTILDKTQYFKLLAFHHAKASNFGSFSINILLQYEDILFKIDVQINFQRPNYFNTFLTCSKNLDILVGALGPRSLLETFEEVAVIASSLACYIIVIL